MKKDAFYVYKAAWSSEPFVHIAGRRREERAEAVTEVMVYSNQSEVTLLVDGVEVGTVEARRAFRFQVPLTGEHEITALAGVMSDAIIVRKVDKAPEATVMPTTTIANWFDGRRTAEPRRVLLDPRHTRPTSSSPTTARA